MTITFHINGDKSEASWTGVHTTITSTGKTYEVYGPLAKAISQAMQQAREEALEEAVSAVEKLAVRESSYIRSLLAGLAKRIRAPENKESSDHE